MKPHRNINLRTLPKLRDSLSYIFVEHGRVERDDASIAWYGPEGAVAIPAATLSTLYLGPGSTITHAAVAALADNGVSVVWVGEAGVRFYAAGIGETRSARNLERQAMAWAHQETRNRVVRRLYAYRFKEPLDDTLRLEQIRGKEGVRVREAYARAAEVNGMRWHGRHYKRDQWNDADGVNRALSAGNACLYGLSHAAIVSLGFSPGLGFLHAGKQLSFVYDIADLYKTEIVVPAAFSAASIGSDDIERRVRLHLRDQIRQTQLLERMTRDLHRLFDLEPTQDDPYDDDAARPGEIYDDDKYVPGGTAYGRDDP